SPPSRRPIPQAAPRRSSMRRPGLSREQRDISRIVSHLIRPFLPFHRRITGDHFCFIGVRSSTLPGVSTTSKGCSLFSHLHLSIGITSRRASSEPFLSGNG